MLPTNFGKSLFIYICYCRKLGDDNATECTGLWILSLGLASVGGPAIVGPLFDAFGSYRYNLFLMCNIMYVLTCGSLKFFFSGWASKSVGRALRGRLRVLTKLMPFFKEHFFPITSGGP